MFIDGEHFRTVKLKTQFKLTPEINKTIGQKANGVTVKVLGLKHMSNYENGIDVKENMTDMK